MPAPLPFPRARVSVTTRLSATPVLVRWLRRLRYCPRGHAPILTRDPAAPWWICCQCLSVWPCAAGRRRP
jgi:hypothetical protein